MKLDCLFRIRPIYFTDESYTGKYILALAIEAIAKVVNIFSYILYHTSSNILFKSVLEDVLDDLAVAKVRNMPKLIQ